MNNLMEIALMDKDCKILNFFNTKSIKLSDKNFPIEDLVDMKKIMTIKVSYSDFYLFVTNALAANALNENELFIYYQLHNNEIIVRKVLKYISEEEIIEKPFGNIESFKKLSFLLSNELKEKDKPKPKEIKVIIKEINPNE